MQHLTPFYYSHIRSPGWFAFNHFFGQIIVNLNEITIAASPMSNSTKPSILPGVLATDLDGTLIPLDNDSQNARDLLTLSETIRASNTTLMYVTGRHFDLTLKAIQQHGLPEPDWIISDVGTTILQRNDDHSFHTIEPYQCHLNTIVADMPVTELKQELRNIYDLRLQEPQKQGPFKLSFYVDAEQLAELSLQIEQTLQKRNAPWSVISSVDPFNGDGLIDLLPASVSKAYALHWWTEALSLCPESVLFAGDSGNDLAALTAGYRAIVVGNADDSVAVAAKEHHESSGWTDRLYLAQKHATSGVLEGCRWFGIF